jgi:hypothetical protein
MTLDVSWTRQAMKLPPNVRKELERRLTALSAYFPEMKTQVRIGITRSYDGLAFQSDDGKVKLMLEAHRRRDGGWKLPTNWTLAHELMHLAQFNSRGIPGGERACDVHALARVPPKYIDDSPSYLVVPKGLRGGWNREAAALAHDVAKEALANRTRGLRRYASWWESELERRWSSRRSRSK